jgi:hypothetical protein
VPAAIINEMNAIALKDKNVPEIPRFNTPHKKIGCDL